MVGRSNSRIGLSLNNPKHSKTFCKHRSLYTLCNTVWQGDKLITDAYNGHIRKLTGWRDRPIARIFYE